MGTAALLWRRVGLCLFVWPLFFVFDLVITFTGVEYWPEARRMSKDIFRKIWEGREYAD